MAVAAISPREQSHQERSGGGPFLLATGGVAIGIGIYEWWKHRHITVTPVATCNPPCGPGCTCDPTTLVCSCPSVAPTAPPGFPTNWLLLSPTAKRCALIYRALVGAWPNLDAQGNSDPSNWVGVYGCAGIYDPPTCESVPNAGWTGDSWVAFRIIANPVSGFIARVSARAGVGPGAGVPPLDWLYACTDIVLGRPWQLGDEGEPLPQGALGGETNVPGSVLYACRTAGAYGGTQVARAGAWAGGKAGWTGRNPEFSARIDNQLATLNPTACAAFVNPASCLNI